MPNVDIENFYRLERFHFDFSHFKPVEFFKRAGSLIEENKLASSRKMNFLESEFRQWSWFLEKKEIVNLNH